MCACKPCATLCGTNNQKSKSFHAFDSSSDDLDSNKSQTTRAASKWTIRLLHRRTRRANARRCNVRRGSSRGSSVYILQRGRTASQLLVAPHLCSTRLRQRCLCTLRASPPPSIRAADPPSPRRRRVSTCIKFCSSSTWHHTHLTRPRSPSSANLWTAMRVLSR